MDDEFPPVLTVYLEPGPDDCPECGALKQFCFCHDCPRCGATPIPGYEILCVMPECPLMNLPTKD